MTNETPPDTQVSDEKQSHVDEIYRELFETLRFTYIRILAADIALKNQKHLESLSSEKIRRIDQYSADIFTKLEQIENLAMKLVIMAASFSKKLLERERL